MRCRDDELMIIVASEPLTDQLCGTRDRSPIASPFVHTEDSGKAKIGNSPSSHSIYIIANRHCPLLCKICMRALREVCADGYAYALLVCTLDLAFKPCLCESLPIASQ